MIFGVYLGHGIFRPVGIVFCYKLSVFRRGLKLPNLGGILEKKKVVHFIVVRVHTNS